MVEDILLPDTSGEAAPFFEGTKAGELRMQRCGECARFRFPPRPLCPWCHSKSSAWVALSGRGTIWSFVVPHPPLLPQFAALSPYNVILVALEEDPTLRLVGNLVPAAGEPIDTLDPRSIEIGEAVRVVFDPVADDVTLPRWVRA